MGFKSKADVAFEAKVQHYIHLNEWDKVEETALQYEAYLKLVEPIPTAEATPEPVAVTDDEPTVSNMESYAYGDEHARWCIETLHRDPVTLQPLGRERDEKGNAALGCLIIVFLFFTLAIGCGVLIDSNGGSSDCYSTPGAQPGSAQAERDMQRCINP